MKKIYKLENLDCAHCAQKMEDAINEIDGINAKINFMAARLTIEAADDNFEESVKKAQKAINGVERDCKIIF